MNRSVLLVLLCLLAAMPPQVCVCDHSDHTPPATAGEHPDEPAPPTDPHDHDDHDGTPADDGRCPCACHVAARVACTAPRVTDDVTCGLQYDVTLATVAVPVRIPTLPPTARCGEPPPSRLHPSVPLFLAVSRLLN